MYGPGPAPQRGVPGPTVAAIAVIALMFGCAAGCIVGVSAAGSPQRPRAAVVPPVAGPTETEQVSAGPGPSPSRTRADHSHGPKVKPTRKPTRRAKPTPDTDPRFASCTRARAAGYGPYRRGVDREYAWYQDRDGDGTVCE